MIRAVSSIARVAAVTLLAGSIAACGHMPWSRHAPPAPRAVSELQELADDGTVTYAFPQYWKRNTLIVDLQGAARTGKVILKPRAGRGWPARLAFRVAPGAIGVLEVLADQRMIIPVTREGTAPVEIELIPGVYAAKTPQLTLQWGN